jgi:hypothetical protein
MCIDNEARVHSSLLDIPETRRALIRVAGWIEQRFDDMKEVTRRRKSTER